MILYSFEFRVPIYRIANQGFLTPFNEIGFHDSRFLFLIPNSYLTHMSRVIAICNQKGGVGKTTTSINLSAYLAMFGKRVLLIDLDPQFNATIGLGVRHDKNETIYHAIIGELNVLNVIKRTSLSGLDIIPASSDLSGALVELIEIPEREARLRNIVNLIRVHYDFIFIDLGPSLNLLTINGLLAADEVIIPVQCEYYALEGLDQLLETIELIRTNLGHPIVVGGALLTMYDKREKLSREIAKEVRKKFPYNVYQIEIPRSVGLAEAPSLHKPIMLYAPQSTGAIAYEKLAREILEEKIDSTKIEHKKDFIREAIASRAETLREITNDTAYQTAREPKITGLVEIDELSVDEGPLIIVIHNESQKTEDSD